MAAVETTTYTVKKGDTLTSIAKKFNTTVDMLVKLNNITDPKFILVGQVLTVTGKKAEPVFQEVAAASIKYFGLQANTDRTVYATWTWDKEKTENYRVVWKYATGDGVWFSGTDTTVTTKQSTYNAPTNATKVKFKLKPNAKTHKVNNKDTPYWTAKWSTEEQYNFSNNPPKVPSGLTAEINGITLTARLTNLDVNATHIHFYVVKDNTSKYNEGTVPITTNSAAWSCNVELNGTYKVRCRAYRQSDNTYSNWSDYTDDATTKPTAPGGISCAVQSETRILIEWPGIITAETYDLEYATNKSDFDISDETTKKTGITTTKYLVVLDDSGIGKEYFFRVRAVNSQGNSDWTGIVSVVVGKKPAAPTTWSSTTTAIVGEKLTLFWVHNSEDGSSQKFADLKLYINGTEQPSIIIPFSENDEDSVSSYDIDTSRYGEGTTIDWKVRTAGITNTYGDWSIQRTVDVYARPTLSIGMTDSKGSLIDTLRTFPFNISASAGPRTQKPIGYHLTISSNSIYETVDAVGNIKMVNKGEEVYSKYFDISTPLSVKFLPSNIDLENNISYTVVCTVSMDSGLSAESSWGFRVAWNEVAYDPNAEINIDKDTVTASIRPYCEIYPTIFYKVYADLVRGIYTVTTEEIDRMDGLSINTLSTEGDIVYVGTDANGEDIYFVIRQGKPIPISGITLSVYRREFDGTFTELATGIENTSNAWIQDPHPALDYARYRVVAVENSTGAVSYCDIPGYPVGEKSIIIQWNETWSTFDVTNEDEMEQPPWSGSLLRLPYNVDVSDKNSLDVSLIKYAGRKHPVSYYGTQIGQTSSWKVDIDKTDKETLYALRRLSIWMGDVYVREPSGSGYWANISVSFSQTHCETTIPVSLEVTRVEGGV